jgi:hypothetical protein
VTSIGRPSSRSQALSGLVAGQSGDFGNSPQLEVGVGRNLLVVLTSDRDVGSTVMFAYAISRRHSGRITLMTVSQVSFYWGCVASFFAPAALEGHTVALSASAEGASEKADEGFGMLPTDCPVSVFTAVGPIRQQVLARVRAARHDAIVIGPRQRAHRVALCQDRLARDLQRLSPVPVLVVPRASSW